MKYYKVVRNVRGRLFSVDLYRKSNKSLCLEYFDRKLTKADELLLNLGYGICCFSIKGEAEIFCRNMGLYSNTELWACAISAQLDKLQKFMSHNKFLKRYWFKSKFYMLVDATWPKGTVMAEQIKLTKRIK
jgi:hypothetical protein